MKFIGIFSKNRFEWTLVDMASWLYRTITVPLYDTLGANSLSYAFDITQISTIFVNRNSLNTLLKVEKLHNLKNVVCFDELDEETI